MKKLTLIALALIALAASCAKEEKTQNRDAHNPGLTLTATIDQTTKATISYNKILWADGDRINVYNGSGFTLFNLSSGAGTGDAEFTQASGPAITPTGVAVFPASIATSYSGEVATVTLPASYASLAAGEIPVPMVAKVEYDTVEELNFKPLTGFIRFGYSSAKVAGAKYFVVETDKKINGEFSVSNYQVLAGEHAAAGDNVIKVEIPDDVYSFIVPLPVGTYGSIKMWLADENESPVAGVNVVEYTDEPVARLDLITASYGCKYESGYTLSATFKSVTSEGKLSYVLFTDPNETGHKYARLYQALSTFEGTHQGSVSDYLGTSRSVYSASRSATNSLEPDTDYVLIMLRVDDSVTGTSSSNYTGDYSIYKFHTYSLDQVAELTGYNKWLGTWYLNSTSFSDNPLVLTITADIKGYSYNLKGLARSSTSALYNNSVMTLLYNTDGTVTLKTQSHSENTFTYNSVEYYPKLVRYVASSSGIITTVDKKIFDMALDGEGASSASVKSVGTYNSEDVSAFRVIFYKTSTSSNSSFTSAPKIAIEGMTWVKDTSATNTSGYDVDPVEF